MFASSLMQACTEAYFMMTVAKFHLSDARGVRVPLHGNGQVGLVASHQALYFVFTRALSSRGVCRHTTPRKWRASLWRRRC
mmetsp:Transcript_70602/g.188461  ORF Transcript_70602/g.188461 Transcript_70602/m.188461 type:complete len:81 (+) Transcript_70602:266-508(+)